MKQTVSLWRIVSLGIYAFCTSCVVNQPESAKTVAAFEIPLPSEKERREFLDIVRKEAPAFGYHVDAASKEELDGTAKVISEAAMTIHAEVWRGSNDDEPMVTIMDQYDHLGQVWIMFSKGENPEMARRFRDRVMDKIEGRWPNTLSLPIMPTGAIPHHRDLIRTPTGYVVAPSAASKYSLAAELPKVAR